MESLSDIVAQMRGRGEDGRMDRHLWNEYADRIEAAAKRVVVSKTETTTVGNAAAMREALDAVLRFIGNLEIEPYSPLDEAASELRQKIMAALSAPARQCDVGTALEQSERFMDFCRPGNRPPNCEECKVYPKRMNKFWCQLEWAQTPYEVEGAGE